MSIGASIDLMGISGTVPGFGAIFMSNRQTMKECLRRKLFGLPFSKGGFVKHVKVGMILFLFEYERRELYGVFQASTDGAIDIVPWAFCSSGKQFSAQVRVTTIWDCTPLTEGEFGDAIRDNYFTENKFNFGLSKDQVHRLLVLFSSKKMKQPERHHRRSKTPKMAWKDGVISTRDSGRFTARVRNDHNAGGNVRLVSATEYREKSLGKEIRTLYDGRYSTGDRIENFSAESSRNFLKLPNDDRNPERFMTSGRIGDEGQINDNLGLPFSPEIPVKYLDDAKIVVDGHRFITSDGIRNQHHVDDGPGMPLPSKYYGNFLGDVSGVAPVNRFQTDNGIESVVPTDYLCKPNLSRLDHSGRLPYFEPSTFGLREQRTSSEVIKTDPHRSVTPTRKSGTPTRKSGTPSTHYSGLPSGGLYDSIIQRAHCSSLGNPFCPTEHLTSPFHPESRGVTRRLDILPGSGNCVSSPDHEYCLPRTTVPLSGPTYSEFNAVESDHEGYRGSSFAGSSVPPVSLLKDETVGTAPYPFRFIDETQHDYGYPEGSHDRSKQLLRSGNSEAYAANVSLSNEVQCHSQEAESMTVHENDKSDHGLRSRKRFRGKHSSCQKSRSSVFSRLTLAADNDSPVNYNEYNVDTVDGLMAILHESSFHWEKKFRQSKPMTGRVDNGEKFRSKKPKTVNSEMERDQVELLLTQENMDAALGNRETSCRRAEGQSVVHFKRRSQKGKSKDEIEIGGFVESRGINGLGGTQKRRKLVRPNFSKDELSHEKDTNSESSQIPQVSFQESSFPSEDTKKSRKLNKNHVNGNKGPEQAGLLDGRQVVLGKNGSLEGIHRKESKEGPEQVGLLDQCKAGFGKNGALDRNCGNENEESSEQAGLLDSCLVGCEKSGALDGNHENQNTVEQALEGPEQAGLLDGRQVGLGKSGSSEGTHREENKAGPEQVGLLDQCKAGFGKNGALDRNCGNENKEGSEQSGLLDACQVGCEKSGTLDRNHENQNTAETEGVGLPGVSQVSFEGIPEAQRSSDIGCEGIKCSVTGTESTQRDDSAGKYYEKKSD